MRERFIKSLKTVGKLEQATIKTKQGKYNIVGIEIIEIDKTNGVLVSGKNRIFLQIDDKIVFDNIVTRVYSSDTPTVEFFKTITSDTQFELEATKINPNDTNVYEININFILEQNE